MNIAETLRARALACPDVPAIVDRHRGARRVTTFRILDSQADACACALICSGLKPGDRVVVFQPMSAELYVALTAVFRVGAVAMFLDPSAGRGHIEQCCRIGEPCALIASPKAHLLRFTSAAVRRIPRKFSTGMRLPGTLPWPGTETGPPEAAPSQESDPPALITFTSGSTGEPKAALRTHGFLLAQYAVLDSTLRLTSGHRDLTTLPVFALANLAAGVTTVIPDADLRHPGDIDADAVSRQIVREQVISTAASPALLERLADHCASTNSQLGSLRKVFVGGAPVFPPLVERIRAIVPSAEITVVYGSTEAEPICELRAADITASDIALMREGRGLLAGRPVEQIALRIMKAAWGRPVGPFTADGFAGECVGAGVPGEIVVAGAHVLSGYLSGRGDQETKFRVEDRTWHRTGDSGYFDAGGRLWLLGRASARIEDDRGVLYPFSVECALSFFPEVKRCAVISHRGRRVLFIEWAHGRGDLRTLADQIAWASVDDWRECRKIPVDRRHNAKIDYAALRRAAGD